LAYQDSLFDFFDNNYKDLLDEIKTTGKLPDTEKLDAAISEFAETFQPSAE
jgi:F-type H+-transporting ATPase subunit alpha